MSIPTWVAFGAVACLAGAGCSSDPHKGYSFASTYPAGVHTVSIPVFDNYSKTPGIEAMVTEAVIKEVQRSTGLKVVSADTADSRLTGVVTGVDLRRLTLDRTTGYVQELAVTITVDFDWKDNRSGKVIVGRRGFAASDTFVPAKPSGERIETGQAGAAQRLAKDLVHELRGAW